MICKETLNSPEIAHIIPASAEGPRSEYRDTYGRDFIKSSSNGLCLCHNCHAMIDDEGLNKYTLEELIQINEKFQRNFEVGEEYKQLLGINDRKYAGELDVFYSLLLQVLDMSDEENERLIEKRNTFIKIPVNEKIIRNELTSRQASEINNRYAFEFQAFSKTVENSPIVSEKIKTAIKILYTRIQSADISKTNSEIFDVMLSLMYDPSNQVVGNHIVLIYFFIVCEVFAI